MSSVLKKADKLNLSLWNIIGSDNGLLPVQPQAIA